MGTSNGKINGHFQYKIIVFQGKFSILSAFSTEKSKIFGIYIAIRVRALGVRVALLHRDAPPPGGTPTIALSWRNSHALSRKPPPQPPSGGATVGCSVAVDEKLRAQAAALDRPLELRNKWPFFNTKSSFFKGNSPFRSTSPEIAMEVHFPWMEVSFAMQKRSSRASAAPNA